MSKFTLADLEKRIAERAQADAAQSYTRALLDKGVAHCAKKMGEEAFEPRIKRICYVVIGATNKSKFIFFWA